MSQNGRYDLIVVGGGSAGCVLANRLSASGQLHVLLIEAGGVDRHPFIHVPGLSIRSMRTPGLMWSYKDEPDPTRDDHETLYFGGRVLGGGSSVNGMVWVRGHPADFDEWAELGCEGWDYANVLPYFRRAESFVGGDPTYRGQSGPQHVSMVRATHPMTDAFVAAAVNAGHRFTSDYNGERQEGVGFGQSNTRRGFRDSTARAYLAPARRRRNLDVMTDTFVRRVVFDGNRAIGVEVDMAKGGRRVLYAAREVVLSGGSLASPKLLMLSGVGPADALRAHGIPVVADRPGVGRNFHEHPVVQMIYNVDIPTFNMEFTPFGVMRHGLRFLAEGRGPAASSFFHAVLFAKLDATARWTEIEAGFGPFALVSNVRERHKADAGHDITDMQLLDRPAVTVFLSLLHPRSRGVLELRSSDPADLPVIRHPMFADERDLHDMVRGCPRGARDRHVVAAERPHHRGGAAGRFDRVRA